MWFPQIYKEKYWIHLIFLCVLQIFVYSVFNLRRQPNQPW
jgi:hypothetical protein